MIKRFEKLFAILFTIGLLHTSPASALVYAGETTAAHPESIALTNTIPAATRACSAEEAQWWESLRSAGMDAATARLRRQKATELPEAEIARLDDEVTATTEKYLDLIRRGVENSYNAPIADRGPIVLFKQPPRFTELARRLGIRGAVLMEFSLRADGSIDNACILRGLGAGLDENCIEAIGNVLFLPAIRNGKFVTVRTKGEFSFHQRYL
jgi:TonB family protein